MTHLDIKELRNTLRLQFEHQKCDNHQRPHYNLLSYSKEKWGRHETTLPYFILRHPQKRKVKHEQIVHRQVVGNLSVHGR